MSTILQALKSRNPLLYGYGLFCLTGTIVCIVLTISTKQYVLGINAFVKPAKFFVSIWIFCWTMGWFTGLLPRQRSVIVYSWVVVVVMSIELAIITGQASLGRLSHFNTSSALDVGLFAVMGVAITILTAWTGYIGYLFFKYRPATVSPTYWWGIRFGILLFVIFAFEGFMMATRLGHTVGAADGGPGLPVTNWSTYHGDLRIAHFFGMHALQLLPLFGYFVAKRSWQVIAVAIMYCLFVSVLLIQALAGKPLL